ncbi:MAG: hypothetical protein ACLSGS_05415 [Adlercreutzia sp.]
MGALSQGRDDCGYVAVGRRPTCALDASGPSWAPMTNPLVNVVRGHGADVPDDVRRGRGVSRGAWPTLDIEQRRPRSRLHEAHHRRAVGRALPGGRLA